MGVIPINRINQNQLSKMSSMQIGMQYHQTVNDTTMSLDGLLPKKSLAWLWIQMSQIYGQLFISRFGTQDNGTWYETLKDLTPFALKSGVKRLRDLTNNAKYAEFPPNCLEFKALCMGFYEDLKLPKASNAYREIKNQAYFSNAQWSHPVIRYISSKLPDDFLEIRNEKDAYQIFEHIYEEVCSLVKQGHPIPEIKKDFKLVKHQNREIGRFYIQEMKKILGSKHA